MTKPLCIDLFCGLGGWTEGFIAEGWDVVGFDIERHRYPIAHIENDDGLKLPAGNGVGAPRWADRPIKRLSGAAKGLEAGWQEYPAQLVLQDILTIHGKQFKTAACIVASPPCQIYSYMAMPWSRAKAIAAEYRSGVRDVKKLTALFDACFRIQREAIDAAGHFIPLVVENVRGAIPWVGRSRWAFGSFHLWGDVPALMPMTKSARKNGDGTQWRQNGCNEEGRMVPRHVDGIKNSRNWWSDGAGNLSATTGSKSPARKAASAMIAKIPLALSRHIAAVYKPERVAA